MNADLLYIFVFEKLWHCRKIIISMLFVFMPNIRNFPWRLRFICSRKCAPFHLLYMKNSLLSPTFLLFPAYKFFFTIFIPLLHIPLPTRTEMSTDQYQQKGSYREADKGVSHHTNDLFSEPVRPMMTRRNMKSPPLRPASACGPLAQVNTSEANLPAFGGEFQPGL